MKPLSRRDSERRNDQCVFKILYMKVKAEVILKKRKKEMNRSRLENTTSNPLQTPIWSFVVQEQWEPFFMSAAFSYTLLLLLFTAISHSLRIFKDCLHFFFLLMLPLQLVHLQRKYPFTNQKVMFYFLENSFASSWTHRVFSSALPKRGSGSMCGVL